MRVLIHSTNRSEPCIDELEVYGPEDRTNFALAKLGASASASSCLPGYSIHQIAHLNDGLYGNSHSWIAASTKGEWAQVELRRPVQVSRVDLSRDREGHYVDRVPIKVDVLVSMDGEAWQTVAQMKNLAPKIPTAGRLRNFRVVC